METYRNVRSLKCDWQGGELAGTFWDCTLESGIPRVVERSIAAVLNPSAVTIKNGKLVMITPGEHNQSSNTIDDYWVEAPKIRATFKDASCMIDEFGDELVCDE